MRSVYLFIIVTHQFSTLVSAHILLMRENFSLCRYTHKNYNSAPSWNFHTRYRDCICAVLLLLLFQEQSTMRRKCIFEKGWRMTAISKLTLIESARLRRNFLFIRIDTPKCTLGALVRPFDKAMIGLHGIKNTQFYRQPISVWFYAPT